MRETFSHQLIEAAKARPGKTAMTLFAGEGIKTVLFGEVLAQTRSIAWRLEQEGIAAGDRVAILGENHPHWAIAYFGILHRGAVAVPLDPAASFDALVSFLEGSESKLAFVSAASLAKFRTVCDRIGRQIPAVVFHRTGSPRPPLNGSMHFEDWAATPTSAEFDAAGPQARPEETAVLMFTSGTTGFPKAVPLSHANIYAESLGVQEAMHITDREIVLGLLPLFHVYSQIVTLWLAPLIGAQVVYLSELTSAAIERALKSCQVTALVGVPRLWYLFHKKIFDAVQHQSAVVRGLFKILLVANGWLRDGLGINAGRHFFKQVHEGFGGRLRLAVSAGASFDADVATDFHRLGFTLLQGYGLTETAGAATVTRFEDNRIGSVGTPLPGVEVRIDQPDPSGAGEVWIRGPIVTSGYYRNPEANRESFTGDRWFRTGDLGRLDSAGHLFIVSRKKDVIKLPSGKNVFPEDVEVHYSQSPLVSEICVIGVRDESSGFARAEKLLGVVVPDFEYLKAHGIANAREAIRWELDNLGRDLPEYQRVHEYLIRAEPLPRTATRKVQRFEVQRQIESSGAELRLPRDAGRFVFTPEQLAMVDSPAGLAVADVIRQHAPKASAIHPDMNLELDLGLDSLARAECVAGLEQRLNITFDPRQAAAALTVGDLAHLTQATAPGNYDSAETVLNWHDILTRAPMDSEDLRPILQTKPVAVRAVHGLLQLIFLLARLLFRLEVKGRDVLADLPRPLLICPNHQSYLDPILICSLYPRGLLAQIFHVGASEYFMGSFMRWLARTLNIVPVDPDVNLLRAMRAGAAGLRAGKILNLYPEGQRSFDGRLHEFKDGAAILATELHLPILPVAIDGAYRVWPRRSHRLRLAKIKIRFGAPIFPEKEIPPEITGEERYKATTRLLRERIQALLDAMRSES
jgi:long-chain acyl-CoA synthetase